MGGIKVLINKIKLNKKCFLPQKLKLVQFLILKLFRNLIFYHLLNVICLRLLFLIFFLRGGVFLFKFFFITLRAIHVLRAFLIDHYLTGDSIESFSTTNTNGYKFSTYDRDNDFAIASCAVARNGAWWYNECTWANLNGIYGNGSCVVNGICNYWFSLTNSFIGAKTSFLMVRRV